MPVRPQIDLASILAQPNPNIDLQLQAFENSRNNFLKAVTNYKNRMISTMSERRTAQVAEKKRIAEKTKKVEEDTDACKIKEIELVAGMSRTFMISHLTPHFPDLEREQSERKEGEASLAVFKRQLSTLHDRCAAVDLEIEQYRAIVGNLRRGTSLLPARYHALIPLPRTACRAIHSGEVLTGSESRAQTL